MALTQRLQMRQSQALVMTPQLMQAIKLLQLSNLDLSAFVEEELERNPLLERASDGTEPPVAGEPVADRGDYSGHEEQGASGDEAAGERRDRDIAACLCIDDIAVLGSQAPVNHIPGDPPQAFENDVRIDGHRPLRP